jgi:translation initiation factor IF-1
LAKKDLVQVSGEVERVLGGGRFQIRLDNGRVITAQLSGRMRRFHIRVIPGDRVQVGVSPYDPSHGFITYREPPGGRPPEGP